MVEAEGISQIIKWSITCLAGIVVLVFLYRIYCGVMNDFDD